MQVDSYILHGLNQSNGSTQFQMAIAALLPFRYWPSMTRHGGQALEYWMSDTPAPFTPTAAIGGADPDNPTGDLAYLQKRKATHAVLVRFQGESDADAPKSATYGERLQAETDYFESRLLLPGGTLYQVICQPWRTDALNGFGTGGFGDIVRAAQAAHVAKSPATRRLLDSQAWERNPGVDTVHLTANGAITQAAPAIIAAINEMLPLPTA